MADQHVSICIKSPVLDSIGELMVSTTLDTSVLSLKRNIQLLLPGQPGIQHIRLIYRGKLLENSALLRDVVSSHHHGSASSDDADNADSPTKYVFHLMTHSFSSATSSSTPPSASSANPKAGELSASDMGIGPGQGSRSTETDHMVPSHDHPSPAQGNANASGSSGVNDRRVPTSPTGPSPRDEDTTSAPSSLPSPLHMVPLSTPFQYVLVNGMPYLLHLPPLPYLLPNGAATSSADSLYQHQPHPMWPSLGSQPPHYSHLAPPGLPPYQAPPHPDPRFAAAAAAGVVPPGLAPLQPAAGAANVDPAVRHRIIRQLTFSLVLQTIWMIVRYGLIVYMLSRNMGIEKAIILTFVGLIVLMVQAGRIQVVNLPANVDPRNFFNNVNNANGPRNAPNANGNDNGNNSDNNNNNNTPNPPGQPDQAGAAPAANEAPPNPQPGVWYSIGALVWNFFSSLFPDQRANVRRPA
ncbi:hypothetical protein H4R33_002866 [Dimargaris cristalligena]|uniref:Ubiquitin-like domain-containing protein n=1 Tax=Dimargaris cristalligena TaxID=215637 RepID=A0A4P9ZPI6_9FUNG|nr:hypothetical protein H4R33_002866 [Dimargaris cristalligena]RKP35155.1 hypothetical protein BJ085DRAFT_38174 [Dimargaris cristalligena]|eukprot:RKP35155.1 hypothetical protein BJ085DRAFT_38174 [Dimargaris cristalligena]